MKMQQALYVPQAVCSQGWGATQLWGVKAYRQGGFLRPVKALYDYGIPYAIP